MKLFLPLIIGILISLPFLCMLIYFNKSIFLRKNFNCNQLNGSFIKKSFFKKEITVHFNGILYNQYFMTFSSKKQFFKFLKKINTNEDLLIYMMTNNIKFNNYIKITNLLNDSTKQYLNKKAINRTRKNKIKKL